VPSEKEERVIFLISGIEKGVSTIILLTPFCVELDKQALRFAALAHIAGWVKRDAGTIFVGFAYLNMPQQSEIALKLANPTRSVADHRLNPTYD